VNTWRRFFGLRAGPTWGSARARRLTHLADYLWSASTSFGPIRELSEGEARRELAKVNEREGLDIDYT
jgi:hypothetical protein